jgi:hypothetical protein
MITTSNVRAEVVFSTFGPGGAFDSLNGSIIEGPGSAFPQAIAEQFSPATSLFLDSVDLAVSSSIGAAEFSIDIYSDSAGVPGVSMESTSVASFSNGIVSVNFSGNTQLDAGSTYWLGMFTTNANTQLWLDTSPTVFGQQAVSEDNGATWLAFNTDPFSRAAFSVSGMAIGPPQPPDISFIEPGGAWRYFRGLSEPSVGIQWTTQGFDDQSWDFDLAGFGYDSDPSTQVGLLSHVETELTTMRDDGVNLDAYTSLYLRRSFNVVNPFDISELIFEIDYDDSFIAYVNGVEVARSSFGTANVPEPFDGLGADHESTNGDPNEPLERFVIDIVNDFPGLLQSGGSNVLAIHGLNSALDDSDFVLSQIHLGGNVLLPFGADFDANGFIDDSDLGFWESSFGVDAGADADFDVDSDGADFLAWQREFTGLGPLAASVIIPEPAGMILLGLGWLTHLLGVMASLTGIFFRRRALSHFH